LSSCNKNPIIDKNKATLDISNISVLIDQLGKQRDQTAFNAYQLAYERAREWNQSARLYEIPSTVLISNNIELLSPGMHWFFMFIASDGPRELYVAVSNNKISGTVQAQPFSFDELPYERLPIEINNLLDSDEALTICIEKNFLDPKEILDSNQTLDYRLINLSGSPVWSIYLSDADPYFPICNINAINGEQTIDPFNPYLNFDS